MKPAPLFRYKKAAIFSLLALALICIISFAPPDDSEVGNPAWESQPPIVRRITIQKLNAPLEDGSNFLMHIQYDSNFIMLPIVPVFAGGVTPINFYDDGTHGDSNANDHNYAGYVIDSLSNFLNEIQAKEATIAANGGYPVFEGHTGHWVSSADYVAFDVPGFLVGNPTPINPAMITASNCGSSLLKQNSLFITDLAVVEDAARTYQPYHTTGSSSAHPSATGNPQGAWTFGTLIQNIVNQISTGETARNFLKQWVKQWTVTQTINGQTVPSRSNTSVQTVQAIAEAQGHFGAGFSVQEGKFDVFEYLIIPWIKNAYGDASKVVLVNPAFSTDPNYWETLWDNAPSTVISSIRTDDNIVINAPFRLMAIVNRLDLMGNSSYYAGMNQTGETRFVFTLISPYDVDYFNGNMHIVQTAGMPPVHTDIGKQSPAAPDDQSNNLDWVGMNVIFEYGNVEKDFCGVKANAQAWANLSDPSLTLGTPTYNADLQTITDKVTTLNSNPLKAHGSAINRIRTNERIFAPTNGTELSWQNSEWQMRQFELDPVGLSPDLTPVPMFNTPKSIYNHAFENLTFPPLSPNNISNTPMGGRNDQFLTWVFNTTNQTLIKLGRQALPNTIGSDVNFLAAVADMDMKETHFWDLDWNATATLNFNPSNYLVAGYVTGAAGAGTNLQNEKKLRQQLSLQTCQGCHGGESKANFTQMYPMGYTQPARYWLSTPDMIQGNVDARFVTNNGNTHDYLRNATDPNLVLPGRNAAAHYYPIVSGFITGRNFSGKVTGLPTASWQDDLIQPLSEDFTDPSMDAFYQVNAPNDFYANYTNVSGYIGSRIPLDQTFGYNDLLLRQNNLCMVLSMRCVPLGLVNMMAHVLKPTYFE